jgi:hypothetical protein
MGVWNLDMAVIMKRNIKAIMIGLMVIFSWFGTKATK